VSKIIDEVETENVDDRLETDGSVCKSYDGNSFQSDQLQNILDLLKKDGSNFAYRRTYFRRGPYAINFIHKTKIPGYLEYLERHDLINNAVIKAIAGFCDKPLPDFNDSDGGNFDEKTRCAYCGNNIKKYCCDRCICDRLIEYGTTPCHEEYTEDEESSTDNHHGNCDPELETPDHDCMLKHCCINYMSVVLTKTLLRLTHSGIREVVGDNLSDKLVNEILEESSDILFRTNISLSGKKYSPYRCCKDCG
jgi:hypothetical protein